MSLLGLPEEVLELICSHCRPVSLKNLRLCCSKLSHVAISKLYQQIVIAKDLKSYENLLCVSTHPLIRNYIRSIVYDLHCLQGPDRIPEDIIGLDGAIDERWLLLWFLGTHSGATLSRLSRISVKDGLDRWGNLRRPPPVLTPEARSRGLRRGAQQNAKRVALRLFNRLARGNHVITELELEGLPWSTFFEGQKHCPNDSALSEVLRKLKSLSLSFGSALSGFDDTMANFRDERETPDSYARLGRLLNGSQNLETLRIRFRYWPEWSESSLRTRPPHPPTSLLPASLLGASSSYPYLKYLHIDAYISSVTDWLSFFESHSPTLTTLDLGSISLQHADGQTSSPCWVTVLKEMQRLLKLTSINFNGLLISGPRRWTIGDVSRANTHLLASFERVGVMPDLARIPRAMKRLLVDYQVQAGLHTPVLYDRKKCLKTQVEIWFVKGGTCPLDKAAVVGASATSSSEVVAEPWWRGDYSWRIG